MDMTKEEIIDNFYKACNDLAEAVNQHLFEGCREDWYWVSDSIGGICDFGDYDTLNTDEMRLIIEKNVTYDQYAEWRNAWLDNFNKKHINLYSWLLGARYEMFDNNNKADEHR